MEEPDRFSFLRQGKVRDGYAAGDDRPLPIVAGGHISVFDHLPTTQAPERPTKAD